MSPAKRWNLLFWYWHFTADKRASDVLSLGGSVPGQNQTDSLNFGDELDIIAKYGISPRSNVLLGWSHFWKGSKIVNPSDADFFYTQFQMNF